MALYVDTADSYKEIEPGNESRCMLNSFIDVDHFPTPSEIILEVIFEFPHVVKDGHKENVIVSGGEEGGFEFCEHLGGEFESFSEVSIFQSLPHEVGLFLGSLFGVLEQFFLILNHIN